ncbi:putative leader peptide [Thermomonospora umbrina]
MRCVTFGNGRAVGTVRSLVRFPKRPLLVARLYVDLCRVAGLLCRA